MRRQQLEPDTHEPHAAQTSPLKHRDQDVNCSHAHRWQPALAVPLSRRACSPPGLCTRPRADHPRRPTAAAPEVREPVEVRELEPRTTFDEFGDGPPHGSLSVDPSAEVACDGAGGPPCFLAPARAPPLASNLVWPRRLRLAQPPTTRRTPGTTGGSSSDVARPFPLGKSASRGRAAEAQSLSRPRAWARLDPSAIGACACSVSISCWLLLARAWARRAALPRGSVNRACAADLIEDKTAPSQGTKARGRGGQRTASSPTVLPRPPLRPDQPPSPNAIPPTCLTPPSSSSSRPQLAPPGSSPSLASQPHREVSADVGPVFRFPSATSRTVCALTPPPHDPPNCVQSRVRPSLAFRSRRLRSRRRRRPGAREPTHPHPLSRSIHLR